MTPPLPAQEAVSEGLADAVDWQLTWLHEISPNVLVRLDENRLAGIGPLIRAVVGELQRSRLLLAALQAERDALRSALEQRDGDAERLDAIASNYWKVDSFEMPTGQGDADVGWKISAYFQAEPRERVVAQVWHDDLRAAIDAAIDAATKGE
jgi:hypothetical protein